MTKVYKNFILFGLDQSKAAQAIAAIDSKMGAGSPTIVGDVCMVTFWGDIGSSPDRFVKESIAKCRNILDNYKITYKLSTFSI